MIGSHQALIFPDRCEAERVSESVPFVMAHKLSIIGRPTEEHDTAMRIAVLVVSRMSSP